MTQSIHKKKHFKKDFTYIRQMLRCAEDMMDANDWSEVEAIMQAISGVAAGLEGDASENAIGIKDARYMNRWEIDEILESREASK